MNATTTQSNSLVGKQAIYAVRGMSFDVTIQEVRQSFGRTDLRITPQAGTGEAWISLDNLTIKNEEQK